MPFLNDTIKQLADNGEVNYDQPSKEVPFKATSSYLY